MRILEQLQNNKGTVSSALGKALAQDVLNGEASILDEAITLCSYMAADKKQKSIRAGAAKVVEIVAMKQPELVADRLNDLLPAFAVAEPQTRWMLLRTFEFCAPLNLADAERALPYAKQALSQRQGLCLSSSAVLYLGALGAQNMALAKTVLPLINKEAQDPIKNEEDWILEAYITTAHNLTGNALDSAAKFASECATMPRKATVKRADKLLDAIKKS